MGKTRWSQTTIETRCWFQKKRLCPGSCGITQLLPSKSPGTWMDAWKHSQCRIQSDHHMAKVSCQHHLSFLIRLWGWMKYGEFVAFMVVDIYPRKGFKSIIACNCKVSWANNQSVLPENYIRTVCKLHGFTPLNGLWIQWNRSRFRYLAGEATLCSLRTMFGNAHDFEQRSMGYDSKLWSPRIDLLVCVDTAGFDFWFQIYYLDSLVMVTLHLWPPNLAVVSSSPDIVKENECCPRC